ADKNFVLRVKSAIETPTVPSYLGLALAKISVSGEIAVRVRTELRVSAKGYFRDPAGYIKNSGFLPPKVGEVTTYTIHWQVVNPANDLENVVLRTTLPAGISWTGETAIPYGAAEPAYNERTGEVIWSIGRVPAQSGIILPAFQAYFRVAAVPSVNQIGNLISIINETEFSGRDVFTGVDLAGKIAEIRSNLPDDPTITFERGIVRE
ncbi:MAG: hypothetical protein Q8L57_00095, partial [bacterium]|nr:hypothetical protein [bacterium]